MDALKLKAFALVVGASIGWDEFAGLALSDTVHETATRIASRLDFGVA